MYCGNCGSFIPDDKNICPVCSNKIIEQNTEQDENNYQPSPPPPNTYSQPTPPPYSGYGACKSRIAAGVLQIFLGSFGVGRFYLGYTGIGVAQLIVSLVTCGVGSLWGFIDGILILMGEIKTDADGNPLRD